MPLLEVVQTRQISASIRLSDTVATQVDQYAAFIRACADDVVEIVAVEILLRDLDEFVQVLKALANVVHPGIPPFALWRLFRFWPHGHWRDRAHRPEAKCIDQRRNPSQWIFATSLPFRFAAVEWGARLRHSPRQRITSAGGTHEPAHQLRPAVDREG